MRTKTYPSCKCELCLMAARYLPFSVKMGGKLPVNMAFTVAFRCTRCNKMWFPRDHTTVPSCCPRCMSVYWKYSRKRKRHVDDACKKDSSKDPSFILNS